MPTLSVPASTIIAKLASGDLKAASVAEMNTLLGTGSSEYTILDRDSTSTSVNTTTSLTTVYSFEIPADTLGTTKLLHLKMTGKFKNDSGGTRNTTFQLDYGAGTLCNALRAVGGPNAFIGVIANFYLTNNGGTSSQWGWFDVQWGDSNSGHLGLIESGTASVDSTAAQDFTVGVQHSFSDVGLDFTHEYSQLSLEG